LPFSIIVFNFAVRRAKIDGSLNHYWPLIYSAAKLFWCDIAYYDTIPMEIRVTLLHPSRFWSSHFSLTIFWLPLYMQQGRLYLYRRRLISRRQGHGSINIFWRCRLE
jgi:hypothetical protein